MNLKTIPYTAYSAKLPHEGKHIVGQMRGENIMVYQAFMPSIAQSAVKNQRFGGGGYAFGRMTWIKPNFLWMMFRAGWATKPNQERILAIEMKASIFEQLLQMGVYSSYKEHLYETEENWQKLLQDSEVRLQWDPDHNPYGQKLDRRAIQIGMKGETARKFATEWIESIEDITPFVVEQHQYVEKKDLQSLWVMDEEVLPIAIQL